MSFLSDFGVMCSSISVNVCENDPYCSFASLQVHTNYQSSHAACSEEPRTRGGSTCFVVKVQLVQLVIDLYLLENFTFYRQLQNTQLVILYPNMDNNRSLDALIWSMIAVTRRFGAPASPTNRFLFCLETIHRYHTATPAR